MPTTLQFRRGTATQNDAYTGSSGELTVDTTNKTIRVHDASTAGGTRLATYSDLSSVSSAIDSSGVISLIASEVDATFINALTIDADTLGGQAGSYYTNASNLASGTVPSARLSLGASDIPSLATSKITSGTFDDARIAASNVTQHQSSLSITESQISDLGSYITASSTDTLTNKSISASQINSGTLDSARLPAGAFGGGSGGNSGIDSAAVIGLVDSAYVQARQASGAGTDPIFKTISVAGQSDVVADTTTDTLTLVGSGIAITTDASTDTITFTATAQDFAYSSLTGAPTNVSSFTNDASYTTFDSTNAVGLITGYGYSTYDSTNAAGQIEAYGYLTSAIDSAGVIALITANDQQRDSAFVTGIVDSAYIQLRQTAQDFAYSSLTGAPNVLDSTNVQNIITSYGYSTYDSTNAASQIETYGYSTYDSTNAVAQIEAYGYLTDALDSAEAIALIATQGYLTDAIDSARITSMLASDSFSIGGTIIGDGKIEIKNGTGSTPSFVDLYCEVSNAHYTRIQSEAHANYSGNVTLTTPTTSGTLALTSDIVDSTNISSIITADVDAAFVSALGTTAIPDLPTSKITSGTFADARIASSNVTQHQASLSITESQISDLGSYITASSTDTLTNKSISASQINSGILDSARLPAGAFSSGGGGSSLTIQEEGSSLSTAATTLNFVGSGVTATGTGSTKTITVSTSGATVGKAIAMAIVFGG